MISMPIWSPGDPTYYARMTIWHNQQNQDQQNQQLHDDYVTAAANWLVQNQSKSAYGQPLPAPPTPPKHVVYNDDGTTTLTEFPDLKPTVMPPAATLFLSGSVVSAPAMDRTDAILMIVTQILNKMNGGA